MQDWFVIIGTVAVVSWGMAVINLLRRLTAEAIAIRKNLNEINIYNLATIRMDQKELLGATRSMSLDVSFIMADVAKNRL